MGATPQIDDDRHEYGVLAIAGPAVADGVYDAALAHLLVHAVQRPGRLQQLRRALGSALKTLHSRWQHAVNRLPPECWLRDGCV